jgi:hypothetical protein
MPSSQVSGDFLFNTIIMKLYTVIETANSRCFRVNVFDSKEKAKEWVKEILTGFNYTLEDIDHNDTWFGIFNTGTSCIEIKEVKLNDNLI